MGKPTQQTENKCCIVFTDGSCSGNGKSDSSGGVGVLFPNEDFNNVSEEFTLAPVTNQRTELYAIIRALEIITKSKKKYKNIILYTDSLYSLKCCTVWLPQWTQNGWKRSGGGDVKNKDLLMQLAKLLDKCSDRLTLKHVRSHLKDESFETVNNNRVDVLAREYPKN